MALEIFLLLVLVFVAAGVRILVAKRVVDKIPQKQFRLIVAVFLGLVALKLIAWPG